MGGGDLSDLSDMGNLGAGDGSSGTAGAGAPTTGAEPGPVGPPPGRPRSGGLLVFAGGILATLALVAGLVLWWPDDDDTPVRADETADTIDPGATASTTAGSGEPSQTTAPTATTPSAPADLFGGDLPAAVADLVAAAGGPTQAIGLSVYPDYAFLAYRDPARPADIDRRMWRDGEAGAASPNPIDDRVDADTEPQLFPISGLDLSILPRLIADAATRYDREVEVTHVIIDRFLPFDQRVLIRVYATPADGRSGGGYVSYDTGGALVGVCC